MVSKTSLAEAKTLPKIKIIAIGGGAINAQNHMIDCGMQSLDFIAVGSHKYGLKSSKSPTKILMGENRLRGLGMLTVPVCREIAEEARDDIKRNLDGSDIVFVVACMGGSTGSGAAAIVASCAREIGAVTIAVVTIPFMFEGLRRRQRAEAGIGELKENVDALITISNDVLLHQIQIDKKTPMTTAFQVSDDAIYRSIQQVSGLLSIPGLVNIDFQDIQPPVVDGKDNEDDQILGGIQWLGRSKRDTEQEIDAKIASQLDRGTLGWLPKSNEDKDLRKAEALMPRTDGKEVCAYLRAIRNDLAKANNIPFESEPCDFEGDCAGTCENVTKKPLFFVTNSLKFLNRIGNTRNIPLKIGIRHYARRNNDHIQIADGI